MEIFESWDSMNFCLTAEKITKMLQKVNVFVHDGINSVADYDSLRVGVGCRMYVCLAQISRLDNFGTPWDIELKFCMVSYLDGLLGKWADRKNQTTPTTLPPYHPTPLPNTCNWLSSTIFIQFSWNLVWKSILEGYTQNDLMVWLGPFSDHSNHPTNLP